MRPRTDDLFEALRPGGGDRGRAYRIVCGSCHAHGEASANRGSLPPELVANLFRARGWTVSLRRARDHLCADCAARRNRTNPPGAGECAAVEPSMPTMKFVMPKPVMPKPVMPKPDMPKPDLPNPDLPKPDMPKAAARAEPPPAPTREDRRIIFAKLEEVYLDEARGYADGWSDPRVAADLNVPRAWVATVRDDNFGPDRAAEEIVAVSAEIKAATREAEALAEEVRRASTQWADTAKSLIERIETMGKRQRALAQRVGAA